MNVSMRYGNSEHVYWVMAAGSNSAFKIAAKPLQIKRRLLLAAYRISATPYLTVPYSTLYYVRFSHNTCVTDDREHIVPMESRPNCWPKTKIVPKVVLLSAVDNLSAWTVCSAVRNSGRLDALSSKLMLRNLEKFCACGPTHRHSNSFQCSAPAPFATRVLSTTRTRQNRRLNKT